MRISIYTYIRNGLSLDFHVVDMLKHHLPLADEVIVLEGYSDDRTYEEINQIDEKIRVYRERWDDVAPGPSWWGVLSDRARVKCTGDWCIKLDSDEFIPEWEFARLRAMLESTSKDLLAIRFKNFYANYKVMNGNPARSRWIEWKYNLHRNLPTVHAVGDGSSVAVGDEPWEEVPLDAIELHHFGAVRYASLLRQKWRNDGAMKSAKPRFDRLPKILYKLAPHDWFDSDFLADLKVYEGPYVKAVRENPTEFIRDGLKLYEWLVEREKKPEPQS